MAQTSSPRPIHIAPSVLPADFAHLGDACIDLQKAGVDRIQWDVMDGHFVPNLTFGPDVIASIRPHVDVPFEAHLMVERTDFGPAPADDIRSYQCLPQNPIQPRLSSNAFRLPLALFSAACRTRFTLAGCKV